MPGLVTIRCICSGIWVARGGTRDEIRSFRERARAAHVRICRIAGVAGPVYLCIWLHVANGLTDHQFTRYRSYQRRILPAD
jgi:hypothetical protein